MCCFSSAVRCSFVEWPHCDFYLETKSLSLSPIAHSNWCQMYWISLKFLSKTTERISDQIWFESENKKSETTTNTHPNMHSTNYTTAHAAVQFIRKKGRKQNSTYGFWSMCMVMIAHRSLIGIQNERINFACSMMTDPYSMGINSRALLHNRTSLFLSYNFTLCIHIHRAYVDETNERRKQNKPKIVYMYVLRCERSPLN